MLDLAGVCVLAFNEEGKVLSIYTDKPHKTYRNKGWGFPGGKPEKGELPPTTAVRKLREETGIEIMEEELIPLWISNTDMREEHLLAITYLCISLIREEPISSDEGKVEFRDASDLISEDSPYPQYNMEVLTVFERFCEGWVDKPTGCICDWSPGKKHRFGCATKQIKLPVRLLLQ